MAKKIPLHGLLYGFAAYTLWGLFPLFFHEVSRQDPSFPSKQLFAHRVIWSAIVFTIVLTVTRDWGTFRKALRSRRVILGLALSTTLIGIHWWLYIYVNQIGQTLQGALNAFLAPLMSVALGMVVFRERLRPAQWVALTLAATGMIAQCVVSANLPSFALIMAASFSAYGLVLKLLDIDGLTGLTIEMFYMLPFAFALLVQQQYQGDLHWSWGTSELDWLVAFGSSCTVLPMLCFWQAARRLPLSVLGFLQYLSPTLQFLLGAMAFGEDWRSQLWGFAFVWAGLALLSMDSLLVIHQRRAAERMAAEVPPVAALGEVGD